MEEGRMGKIIEDYFGTSFTTSDPSGFDEILCRIQPSITDEMNATLTSEFTTKEVHQALKQMAPTTAPSPNGMSPIFCKSFWKIVGDDVTKIVLNALNTGVVHDSLNATFISLIPKIKNPKRVSDFRPISFCNVIYKLISKVLVNRLKQVLPNIVSGSQSAFLSGRLITDNVLVAFETLHYLKRKTKGKLGYMALKLDMSKAYDRMEWIFLEKVMRHVGFADSLIKIIMSCISSVSYAVLLNGQPMGNIKPTRGLRQGDPLSPYLFLLCALGLQGLLKKAEVQGDINGVSICCNGPKVSHLFFADDSVLFCRAKEKECQTILDLLAIYERGSGQKINREKTNIFFSSNTLPQVQSNIQQLVGVPAIRQYEKYLGLPALVGRAKKQSFVYLKERVWRKFQGWKEKILSHAGREVLIKSVIQAIPTYTMSCFKLPKGLVKELEVLIRKYWWRYNGDS